jgi:general secretion pathway protein H
MLENERGDVFLLKHRMTDGFTLLELIIVLIIIGISSALVVPRFIGGMGGLDLKTASGKVAASLRYARSQAVSQKAAYTAVFDLEHNRLKIISEGAGETEAIDPADGEERPKFREERYDLPEGIFFERVDEGENAYGEDDPDTFTIGFYPSGASDGGTIAVVDERKRGYIVTIDVITGSVKLARGEDE